MYDHTKPQIPKAPNSIEKGSSLSDLLDDNMLNYLARNIELVYPKFNKNDFINESVIGIKDLTLINRARFIATSLHNHLPFHYEDNIKILLESQIEEHKDTNNFGLSGFYYLPLSSYVAQFGISEKFNKGNNPFDISMNAQYEMTKRFSCEFSIRYFLIDQELRTLEYLKEWQFDKNPHVRRLCSEGTRPRLPWGIKLKSFDLNPEPIIPILENLKNDSELYVRRSVANNLGDISKNNPNITFDICHKWLKNTNEELNWLMRHAVRYHAKKKHPEALNIRKLAK